MDLIISAEESSWSRTGDVKEIVILDATGETAITPETASQLRVLRSCILFCLMATGESMWCALSYGVMSINADGRVLITSRRIILFNSEEQAALSRTGS